VIQVSGPLRWPGAARLTEFVPASPTAILLDLTAVTSIDNTGIAVLASIAAQLNHTGRLVRVAVADEQLRRQLPRTAGLHNIFASIDDASRFGAGTPETRP
jgi:anti-anti-sigma factor